MNKETEPTIEKISNIKILSEPSERYGWVIKVRDLGAAQSVEAYVKAILKVFKEAEVPIQTAEGDGYIQNVPGPRYWEIPLGSPVGRERVEELIIKTEAQVKSDNEAAKEAQARKSRG